MNLGNLILAAVLVLLLGSAVFAVTVALRNYLRYRGQRLVTCPENKQSVAVHVNTGKAMSAALIGKQEVRLDQCTRWPERQNCGQDCLSQVNADPARCLVWNIVADWYKGKSCAYCEKPFGEIHWHDHPPALLSHERIAIPWTSVRPDQLPAIFETHLPVCWNCYIAETYRREHADRVLNRNWERGAGGQYVPKGQEEEKEKKTPENRAASV